MSEIGHNRVSGYRLQVTGEEKNFENDSIDFVLAAVLMSVLKIIVVDAVPGARSAEAERI